MLLQMGKEVIDHPSFYFDIKWDGFRILLHKKGDRIEAFSRHGNNLTSKFPELQEVGHSIKAETAIIDCEGVVLRNGISVFTDFAYRGRLSNKERIEEATQTHPATFVAFDILQTNKPHLNEPLIERKKRLSSVIEPSNSLVVTPSIQGEGSTIFQLTKEKNMEGIVGKRIDSKYQLDHRSNDWLKFKHFKMADAVILGYKENPFTMIVGAPTKKGSYKPLASIEFGFKPEEKAAFRKISKQIVTKVDRNVTWLEPRLCCTIQYLEKTERGSLRICSFKGFNFNKAPEECLIV
ncbi:DNA ligase [Butyricicoccus sp. 1XD8-22]|nr:DNA ligase [Butyricicoccus sp. 1XD8-22]